jgi:iron complex transport system ATP-binding protein
MSLVAQGISVRVRGKDLLDGVSVTLTPGQVTAVVGPNGAGKSTLLRVLARERRPDAGTITLHGCALEKWCVANLARVRAVLPQSSALCFDFHALEVVLLGRMAHGTHTAPRDLAIAREALALVGLGGFESRLYPGLSGGERQRVHLARVLAQIWDGADADLGCFIMLDEPTASLDLAHQHTTLSLVRDFATSRSAGVLLIIHDLNLAGRYADSVVMINEGQVVAAGSPDAVLTSETIERGFGIAVDVARDLANFPVVIAGIIDSSNRKPGIPVRRCGPESHSLT